MDNLYDLIDLLSTLTERPRHRPKSSATAEEVYAYLEGNALILGQLMVQAPEFLETIERLQKGETYETINNARIGRATYQTQ